MTDPTTDQRDEHETCDHRDAFGSTIIAGATPDAPDVCIVCNMTAPFLTVLGREHEMTSMCWCRPVTSYEDPITGDRVFTHRTLTA